MRNYSLERYFRQKYFGATNSALKTGTRRSLYFGVWVGLAKSATLFATGEAFPPFLASMYLSAVPADDDGDNEIASMFHYGTLLASRKQEDLPDIVSVFALLLFSLSSATTIVGLIPQISNCKNAAQRVLRLSTLPKNSHENEGSLPPPSGGEIIFKDVAFSYPTRPDTPVLSGLSLAIAVGECITIVGASGSGKSTLSTLLQQLYLPTEGEITFDGVPLRAMSTCLLREKLAVLSQCPTLFNTTIAENITYGLSPGCCGMDDVYGAAMAAGIHTFIMSLPEGYSTMLGNSGSGLSMGQAQRVSIARALVRKPQVLVLDECTSALDAESVKIIEEAVKRLKGGITVIAITHSMEPANIAQRIVLIKEGRAVVEERGRGFGASPLTH